MLLLDDELRLPEGVIQPITLQGMQVHTEADLINGDFFKHGWQTLEAYHLIGQRGRSIERLAA